jgi:hypothetical protein
MDQMLATRAEILCKAWADPTYRQSLVKNPKEVIAREFAVDLPDGLAVTVLEDTADTIHLILVDPADLPEEEKAGPRTAILAKAWTDSAFKKALLADPAAAIKEAFGATVLPGVCLKAVEQTDNRVYITIPTRPSTLSDADLDNVAGGTAFFERLQSFDGFKKIPVVGGFVNDFYSRTGAALHEQVHTIETAGKAVGHAVSSVAKKIFHGW